MEYGIGIGGVGKVMLWVPYRKHVYVEVRWELDCGSKVKVKKKVMGF